MTLHPVKFKARKRFGQHFLRDTRVIQNIINSFAPRARDRVVEIGPGTGALTTPLLQHLDTLEVIELDRDLIAGLRQLPGAAEKLRIHGGDALKFDLAALRGDDPRPLRIIGNLPYNISTPLLFHLLEYSKHIQDMLFMLQKEVVRRLTAAPGTSAYGRLSVMLHYHCAAQSLFDIPPAAFAPPPKVDSSIVQLRPHAEPPCTVSDYTWFAKIVAQAFSQRRKTLRNSLKSLLTPEHFSTAGIDPALRAEVLSLEQFAALAECSLIKHG